jgi:hypothetical protein
VRIGGLKPAIKRGWGMSARRAALAGLLTGALGAGPSNAAPALAAGPGAHLAPASPGFEVGAAQADITPPALATALGAGLDRSDFMPTCGSSEAQIEKLWPGRRLFAFEDPYVDLSGKGEYVPGDPYCDADGAHRYQAPYIAGGAGENRWPLTSADLDPAMSTAATTPHSPGLTDDPITAQAVVFRVGGRRVAVVTVNSIGMFDTAMEQIRSDVERSVHDLAPQDIFISSTHDESAPDPIGLWGPDLSGEPSPVSQLNGELPAGVSSGVDEFYMSWMEQRVAGAIVAADRSLHPARLRVAYARMPTNVQSCWSSYPFIDTDLMPVMQGISDGGRVIFTLVNVGTHDETLGFSGNPAYTAMLSGDWTGRLSERLEQEYPGSVGMEMAGLVGSVETPALYPQGTVVQDLPGRFHSVPGNPVDGCSSVYPEPVSRAGKAIAPYTDALAFIDAYAASVADTAIASLRGRGARTIVPRGLAAQTDPICLQLENNFFVAAFAADLFPDRPAYADPDCSVGAALAGRVSAGSGATPAAVHGAAPLFIRSEVGVLTLGPVQIAYSPGEVFPVTEVGGPYDLAQMPFPTDCYLPGPTDPSSASAGDYTCGSDLPMTPDVSAEMTEPWRFLAGLGEDMVGYMFPPSNFVGSQGETAEAPWSTYELSTGGGDDRFGYPHADDAESVGPSAGLAVTEALSSLLARDGRGTRVLPGLFFDSAGRLCDSPFPTAGGSWVAGCPDFSGAIGVRVVEPGGGVRNILVGRGRGRGRGEASAWATYLGTPDGGTAGTAYRYSTATRGVIVGGRALLLDVVAGARELGLPGG